MSPRRPALQHRRKPYFTIPPGIRRFVHTRLYLYPRYAPFPADPLIRNVTWRRVTGQLASVLRTNGGVPRNLQRRSEGSLELIYPGCILTNSRPLFDTDHRAQCPSRQMIYRSRFKLFSGRCICEQLAYTPTPPPPGRQRTNHISPRISFPKKQLSSPRRVHSARRFAADVNSKIRLGVDRTGRLARNAANSSVLAAQLQLRRLPIIRYLNEVFPSFCPSTRAR